MKFEEKLRMYVGAIMEDKYEKGMDLFVIYTIVIHELITDYEYDWHTILVYGTAIKTWIEEWISQNTND